jgi:16S rRNA (guanine966-N2)-methyltransferase
VRIAGGRLRGRTLATPEGLDIRPTSDRVREAIFNILLHGIEDFRLQEARVLDLFSGTGALGLEALSRGAAFALFIDTSAEARGLIRQNAETLGLMPQTKLYRRDAASLENGDKQGVFNLVFADPPYGQGLAEKALASALAGGWLAPDAVAVIEEAAETALELPAGLEAIDRRVYGRTAVTFARHTPA